MLLSRVDKIYIPNNALAKKMLYDFRQLLWMTILKYPTNLQDLKGIIKEIDRLYGTTLARLLKDIIINIFKTKVEIINILDIIQSHKWIKV